MRYLASCILLVLMAATCTPKELKNAIVTMHTQTRGYEDKVVVAHSQVTAMRNIATDEKGEQTIVTDLTDSQLNALLKTARSFDYTQIDQYPAPSKNSTFDRAAVRTLTIEYDGKVYRSVAFDHNNPPAELKPLVDALSVYLPN